MGKHGKKKIGTGSAAKNSNGAAQIQFPSSTSLSGSELVSERVRLKQLELVNSETSMKGASSGPGAAVSSSSGDGSLNIAPIGNDSPSNCIKVLNKCSVVPVSVSPDSPCPTSLNIAAPVNFSSESFTSSPSHVEGSIAVDEDSIDSANDTSPSVTCTLGDSDSVSEDRVLEAMDRAAHLSSPEAVSSSVNLGNPSASDSKFIDTAVINDVDNRGSSLHENIDNVGAGNVVCDAISDFWLSKNIPVPIVALLMIMGSGRYVNLLKLHSKDIPFSEIKYAMNRAAHFSHRAKGMDREAINKLVSEIDIGNVVAVLEHIGLEAGDTAPNAVNGGFSSNKTCEKRDSHPILPENSAWKKSLFPKNRLLDSSRRIERHATNVIDIEADLNEHKFTLIGHFVGKRPDRKDFEIVRKGWNVRNRVFSHTSSWIIIMFPDEESLEKVLNGGPYFINGVSLLLKRIPKLFNFRKEDICVLPVWVKLLNLPIELYNKKCIGKIVQNIGEPLFIDELTDKQVAYNYARALVEIDVSVMPPDVIDLPFSDGSSLLQPVTYEQMQGYCKHCKCLGHFTVDCKPNPSSTVPDVNVHVNADSAPINAVSDQINVVTAQKRADSAPKTGENVQKCAGNAPISAPTVITAQLIAETGQIIAETAQKRAETAPKTVEKVQICAVNAPVPAPTVITAQINAESAQITAVNAQKRAETAPKTVENAQICAVNAPVSHVVQAIGTGSDSFLFDGSPVGRVWNNNEDGKKKKKNKKKISAVDAVLGLPAIDSGSSLNPS